MHVNAILDVPDFNQHEIRHHGLEGDVLAIIGIVKLEFGR